MKDKNGKEVHIGTRVRSIFFMKECEGFVKEIYRQGPKDRAYIVIDGFRVERYSYEIEVVVNRVGWHCGLCDAILSVDKELCCDCEKEKQGARF